MSKGVRRFQQPTIKWTEFQKLVNPEEKNKFLAFKGKSEMYLRRVLSNPEKPPPIDWEAYKKVVPDISIIDKLKAEYEKFQVPYPKDTLSTKVDQQWKELVPKIKDYCTQQQKIVASAKKELDRINSLPPFETITMEMFHDLYPDLALKPVEKPTFWPHDDEEQLGYLESDVEKKK